MTTIEKDTTIVIAEQNYEVDKMNYGFKIIAENNNFLRVAAINKREADAVAKRKASDINKFIRDTLVVQRGTKNDWGIYEYKY